MEVFANPEPLAIQDDPITWVLSAPDIGQTHVCVMHESVSYLALKEACRGTLGKDPDEANSGCAVVEGLVLEKSK